MKTVHADDSGVSDIVGTVLIIAIVVVILASAVYIVDVGLPNRSLPSANVVDNNVTFHFVADGQGYLAGSFVYESGPVLSNGSAYFYVLVGGKTYYYSLSAFQAVSNPWDKITSGTVVTFNSSAMLDQYNQPMPFLTSGENYTMEFKDQNDYVWHYSATATPFSSRPIIANSWYDLSSTNGIDVYVASYGNSSVVVKGNFSSLYGHPYGLVYFQQSTSPGVYYISLPNPPYSGYYQITESSFGYSTDEWFYLNWTNVLNTNTITPDDSLNILFDGIPSTYLNEHGVVVQVTNPATAGTFVPAETTSNQYAWYGTWMTLTSNESFNDSALQGTTQSVSVEIHFPSWLGLYTIEGPGGSNVISVGGNSLTDNYAVDYISFIVAKGSPTDVYINFTAQRSVVVEFSGFPSWGRWNGSLSLSGSPGIPSESFTNSAFQTINNVTWIASHYGVDFSISALTSHQKFTIYYVGGNTLNANHNVTVLVNATSAPVRYYSIHFVEQGLPSGTQWQVVLNGTSGSTTGTMIGFSFPNGSYAWSLGAVQGWHANSYGGTVNVNGANVTIDLTWAEVKYNETFTETGLPSGMTWGVTVAGLHYSSSQSIIDVELPNATYSWRLDIVAGWTGSPYTGSFTINGNGGNVQITFIRTVYTVSFVESGLNTNALWNVTFNGTFHYSTSGVITFSVPNGTYSFTVGKRWGWGISPSSGAINVNGGPLSQTITFIPIPTYTVTFEESGIAPGYKWYANITNTTDNGMNSSYAIVSSGASWSSTISFEEFDGQYSYTTYSAGFQAYSWSVSSPITINGNNIVVRIYFKQVTYGVWLVPSGLPYGTSWSAYLNVNGNMESRSNTYSSGNNGSVEFSVMNGSYSYSVPALNGYKASPSSGSVNINGGGVTVAVNFVRLAYTIWFNATGLDPGSVWYVNISGASFRGTSSTITVMEYDGQYYYTAAASGYVSNPSSGYFNVNGGNQTVNINFTPSVIFVPNGLSSNTFWQVWLYDQNWPYYSYYQGGTGDLVFTGVPSGSYTYSVTSSISVGGGYQYGLVSESPGSPMNVNGPTVVNIYYSEEVYVQASSYYNTYLWGYYNGQVLGPYYGSAWFPVGASVYASSQEAFYGNQYMSSGVVTSTRLVNQSLDFGGQTYGGYPYWWFNNPQGNFVVMFYGWVYAPTSGWYGIGTTSDDASAVWTGYTSPQIYDWSNLVVNNWYQQGATFRSGSTYLWQGYNYITVAYEQGNGGYALNLQWQPPSQSWQEMPVTGTAYVYYAPFPSSSTGTLYSPSANGGNPTQETFYDPVFWDVQSISQPAYVSASWSNDYYYLSMSASPSNGGSVSPGSGWYQYGQYVGISASASSGYSFQTWDAGGNYGGWLGRNGYVYMYGAVGLTAVFAASLIFVPENLPANTYWQVYTNEWGWQGGTGDIVFTGQSGNVYYQVNSPVWVYDSNLNEYTYMYARPSSGYITVNGPAVVYINWVIPLWTAWFNETGLASGTIWSVTVNGQTYQSSSSSIAVQEPYGQYYYQVNVPSGYQSEYGTGGWVYLQGYNQTVNELFEASVWFVPVGIPTYNYWQILVNDWSWYSNWVYPWYNGSIQAWVPLGYTFTAYPAASYYDPNPSSGVISQPGPIYIYYSAPQHPVFFNETGLAGGYVWSVTLNGAQQTSGSSSIVFWENPGQYYSYTITANGYQVNPSSGQVYVSNTGQTVNVYLQASIVFVPQGFPSNDNIYWEVYDNGWGWQGAYYNGPGTGDIVFTQQYGTYYYQTNSPTQVYIQSLNQWVWFYSSPTSGTVAFYAPTTVYINWYAPQYAVTFDINGLPSGTSWSVTIGSDTQTTTASSITFNLYANSNYYYYDSASGYQITPSSGYVYVGTSDQVVTLQAELGWITFTPQGLSPGVEYETTGTSWNIEINGNYWYAVYGWTEHVVRIRWWFHVVWRYSSGTIYVYGADYGISTGTPYEAYAGTSGNGQSYYPSSGTVQGVTNYVYFNTEAAPPLSTVSPPNLPQYSHLNQTAGYVNGTGGSLSDIASGYGMPGAFMVDSLMFVGIVLIYPFRGMRARKTR